MNPQTGEEARILCTETVALSKKIHPDHQIVICPPAVYLHELAEEITSRTCVLGAQDCFWEDQGSFTGYISPPMIFSARARYVILGHSERRALGETDDMIHKKVAHLLLHPLTPIVCIGETNREGNFFDTIRTQVIGAIRGLARADIMRIIFAYEPVWAIGAQSTREATPLECREMMYFIRKVIAEEIDTDCAQAVTILFGGSVSHTNAYSYITEGEAQGLLVGRASLSTESLQALFNALHLYEKNN
jgi:triosephosphate isomerase (TIM)